jgi:hypothetical protein
MVDYGSREAMICRLIKISTPVDRGVVAIAKAFCFLSFFFPSLRSRSPIHMICLRVSSDFLLLTSELKSKNCSRGHEIDLRKDSPQLTPKCFIVESDRVTLLTF